MGKILSLELVTRRLSITSNSGSWKHFVKYRLLGNRVLSKWKQHYTRLCVTDEGETTSSLPPKEKVCLTLHLYFSG